MIEHIDWHEFVRRVADRRTAYGSWGSSSLAYSDSGWRGTETFEDMQALLTHGWPEGTARLARALETLNFKTSHLRGQAKGWAMDVAGAYPCVSTYLAGDCEYMHAPDCDSQQAPTRRVMVDGTHPARMSVEQVETYGLAVLAMIDAWEEAGESVELVWHFTAQNLRESRRGSKVYRIAGWHSLQVTIKRAGEHFDMDRLAFAMAHPSMLRRAAFAVVEQIPAFRTWNIRYGAHLDTFPHEDREPGTVYLPCSSSVEDDLDCPVRTLTAMQALCEL